MMDSSGMWIALSAIILSGATLWNGARRTTVDMLSRQVEALKSEVIELRAHCNRCADQLKRVRDENTELMKQLLFGAREHGGRSTEPTSYRDDETK
jgi:outer membrane murein-binding lipoprotein Lpp